MNIQLNLIYPDPDQPRYNFTKIKLYELQQSIVNEGILTPLLLESNYKNGYLILDGERRYRCAKELKLLEVPAKIILGPLTFAERTITRFNIQLQHSTWTEIEKARAIYNYKKATQKTLVEIAEVLGLHATKIHAYLSILDFTPFGQKLIDENKIDFTYLIFLIRVVKHYLVFSNLKQEEIEEKIINKIKNGAFDKLPELVEFSKVLKDNEHIQEKIEFLNNADTFFAFQTTIGLTGIKNEIFLDKKLTNFKELVIDIVDGKYVLKEAHKNILQSIEILLKSI